MGYGQYSRAAGAGERYTLGEMLPAGAHNARKAGHNRCIYSTGDAAHFRLRETDVVTRNADGTLTLRDGGWQTVTTRAAMMQGVQALAGINVAVYGNASRDPARPHVLVRTVDGKRTDTPFACPFTFDPES